MPEGRSGTAIGIIGKNKDLTSEFISICQTPERKNFMVFESGMEIHDFLRIQPFELLFVFSEIKDIHWTNFLRKIQIDDTIPYIPVILVFETGYIIEPSWKNLISDYKVRAIIYTPFKYDTISKLLAENAHDNWDETSMQRRLKTARYLYQEGMIKQSKKLYNEILSIDENNLVARSGLLHTEKENLKEFQSHFDRALKQDPENYCFKFELLSHCLKTNDQKKFNEILTELMTELYREKEIFWLNELGDVCLQLGFPTYSEKIANEIIKNKDVEKSWRQYSLISRVKLAEGKLEEAAVYADKALGNCDEPRADVLNLIGVIKRRMRKFEEAIKYFDSAARAMPMDHRIYYNAALSFRDIGKNSEAAIYLRKALSICEYYEKASKLLEKLEGPKKA
ncbi:MAG: hypothetical protein HQK54_08205 [Oligoflexales bacterium]|nr:hypothetical protein [Oligoflexales bacterium]